MAIGTEGGVSRFLTRAERQAAGKALRSVVPRERHADFVVDPARDPLPILAAQDAARVSALIPVRYQRMAVSPFTFYRGAAALMAHDLGATARIGLPVQACGDCHLMNFGAFSSPEGRVLFDINDFDETQPGVDFVVDLKRLVASVVVAAQDAGLPDRRAQGIAAATAAAYRAFMSTLAGLSPLDAWAVRMDLKEEAARFEDADLETAVLTTLLKAEKQGKAAAEQPGIATAADGTPRFVDKPPFLYHVGQDGEIVAATISDAALGAYKETLPVDRVHLLARYGLRDCAFKVVGVGSVGTYCAVALMATADGEMIVLQFKQAMASVVEALASGPPAPAHQGRRVVDGQRAMQAASDPFLGWTQDGRGRHFYVRMLKNRRLGSIAEALETKALPAYATLCARTLARAHARTGDAAMIAGYIGTSDALDQALVTFAMSYASQTVLDHARLLKHREATAANASKP